MSSKSKKIMQSSWNFISLKCFLVLLDDTCDVLTFIVTLNQHTYSALQYIQRTKLNPCTQYYLSNKNAFVGPNILIVEKRHSTNYTKRHHEHIKTTHLNTDKRVISYITKKTQKT